MNTKYCKSSDYFYRIKILMIYSEPFGKKQLFLKEIFVINICNSKKPLDEDYKDDFCLKKECLKIGPCGNTVHVYLIVLFLQNAYYGRLVRACYLLNITLGLYVSRGSGNFKYFSSSNFVKFWSLYLKKDVYFIKYSKDLITNILAKSA